VDRAQDVQVVRLLSRCQKEKAVNAQNIREHMPVIASCGKRIGTVDRVEGSSIKLTRSAPAAHGEHRFIPLSWVESVGENVRLNKSGDEAEQQWQEAPAGAGPAPGRD
jgi:hypothetical protein